MKILNLSFAVLSLMMSQRVSAQTGSHVTLSANYPKAGETVTLTYNPAGTVLDGKKDINAVVYYLDNKDYPAADVDLKAEGSLLKGKLTIPRNTAAFFIKLSTGKTIDNNSENGYVYLIYKDGKPVKDAYASEGWIYNGLGKNLAAIKRDKEQVIILYKQDIQAYPDKNDNEVTYYSLIAGNSKYKVEYDQKLADLKNSTKEKDLVLEYYMLKNIHENDQVRMVKQVLDSKYPDNDVLKNDAINSLMREQDAHKKDSLFTAFKQRFPQKPHDGDLYSIIATQLATVYGEKDDLTNYEKYKSGVTNEQQLTGMLNNLAWNWAEKGKNLDQAERMSKQSVDILQGMLDNPQPEPFRTIGEVKKSLQYSWNANADTYAYVLWKENKSAEALPIMKKVYDLTSNEANSIEHYAEILAGTGQYDKALDVLSTGMKAGQSSDVIKGELKKDYVKVKGSDHGYDKYLAGLENVVKNKLQAELAKTMINQPAPAFILKDLDGNTVSLADLKGKVVIIDFWATWCGPCKASFPGMQMAVNKYKDDPNVKFLFIDTWETAENYLDGVKKFIGDNNYTFHVLIDEKAADGRQAKVVTTFDVSGIPTKFIIDKNGYIRFKHVGYSGSSEKVFDEVVNMVDMAANPEAFVSNQKENSTKASINK